MAEYIEREAVCSDCKNKKVCIDKSVCPVGRAPAADVVPVKHGRWIPLEYDGYADGSPVWDLWECSECQEEHSGDEENLTPYCPNCAAKMEVDNG